MTRLFDYDLELLDAYKHMAFSELQIWERFYLPASPVGLTILDVGAGCGETAAFYLSHGAKRIIAVEPDPEAFSLLERNAEMNGMDVEAINEPFALEHLSLKHDLMKMDIEGGETLLLDYEGRLDKPLVMEAHSDRIANPLIRRFALKRVFRMTEVGCPHMSLLHHRDSPVPESRTTFRDYLGIARVAFRERVGNKIQYWFASAIPR